MANPFDQFDAPASESANPFDQFDEAPKTQNKGIVGDTFTDLKRGIEQLPGAFTGVSDLVNPLTYITGTRMADKAADWVGEKTGFQPGKWQKQAASEYSPERKASDEAISKAWDEGGAANIAGAIATNPRSILGVVGQSAPSMIAGGGAARLAMKGLAAVGGTELAALSRAAQVEGVAGDAARETMNRLATTAGAVGEGAVTAGQNMDQVSRDVDPAKAAATSLAAGLITGGIGKVSGRIANKLGLPDVETAMAGGGLQKSGMPWYKRIPSAAAQEGLLQEFPQSAQEQIWQNLAEDKPWYEGALRQGVEGALAGGVMGGGAGILAGRNDAKPAEQPTQTTIAGLLPSPTNTGTPSDQVLQSDVERQNAMDAAQTNADRIYAERDLYEETMKTVFPYGVPTVTAPIAPIQQRIDELTGVDQTKLKGLQRVQYQKALEKAYNEPVGITHDENGLEIPLTMGDLLNSQATVETTLREKREQAIDNASTQAQARNDQVASEESQPIVVGDPITGQGVTLDPNAGPLSKAAVIGVGTGAVRTLAQEQAQLAQAVRPIVQTPAIEQPVRGQPQAAVAEPSASPVVSDLQKVIEANRQKLEKTRQAFAAKKAAAPAQDVSGGQINKEWSAFSPESGTLGVPRAEMPQIRSEHRGAMTNFMNARGVAHQQEEVPADSLRPTQAEFSTAKVKKALGFEGTDRSILVSSDNYVLDGHHQWLAKRETGAPIKIIRLDAPIQQLITLAHEFPSSKTASGATAPSTQQKGMTDVAIAPSAQAVQTEAQGQEQQSAAAVVRGYPKGQATMLANRLTKQNLPSEIYPHPTLPGMFAIGVAGQHVESAPASAPPTIKGENHGQESASQTTEKVLIAPVAMKSKIPPNQRRDDLVGAILRATGGAGIASIMADTIVGEKANKVGKLRGLFTNAGQQDLGDLAMLLREQEGYDVRDASHLEELVRAAASGDVPKSMARQEADAEAAKEKQYRDEIRAKAKKYGIKTVAVKFSEMEKRVFETIDQRRSKSIELLDSKSQERFNSMLDQAMSALPEEVVDETLADVNRRGLHARDFWIESAKILRGMVYDAAQEKINEPKQSDTGNAQDDGRGTTSTGRGNAAEPGDQAQPGQVTTSTTEEVAPALELAGQTPAEVRAQEAKRKTDEEAAQREDKPKTPTVTADQVDLFNTQGGIFDQPAVAAPKETAPNLSKPAEDGKSAIEAESAQPERREITPESVVEQADSIEPARIEDFGEKIGGARKDKAVPLGPRGSLSKAADERPVWARKFHAMQIQEMPGRLNQQNVGRWQIMEESGAMKGAVRRAFSSSFATEQDALDALPMLVVNRKHGVYPYKQGGKDLFGIFRNVTDRKRAMVQGGFETKKAAEDEIAKNPAAIIEHKFEFPERPWLDKIQRIGNARLKGDVTTKMFQSTFGFRGGEFGNWNMGGDGQAALNHAYEALLDLAEAINVPPKALSLNGELAIAFGARGTGGTNSASAHYEPGSVVINLTKIKGAGSLAHEWWHAVDHYFARNSGYGDSISVVANNYGYKSAARPELITSIKNVVDSIMHSEKSTTTDATLVRNNAEKRIAEALSGLDYRLKDLRRYLSETQYRKKKTVATTEQLAQWDALVAKLRDGDEGETVYVDNPSKMRGTLGFSIGSNIRDLNTLYKSITGSSFLRQDPQSTGRAMQWNVKAIADNKSRVTVQEDVTSTYKGRSEYYIEARRIDQQRVGDYWSKSEEMGARAFESYIFDKISETGNRSDYLVYGVENRFYAAMDMKPYPEGEERQRIDASFDKLFGTIQTKDTEKGIALESRGLQASGQRSGTAPVRSIQSVVDKFKTTFKGTDALNIRVVQSVDDIPAQFRPSPYAEGVFHDDVGLIYLVADNLMHRGGMANTERTFQVLAHEIVGHAGLASMMGDRFNGVLKAVMQVARDSSVKEDIYEPGENGYATVEAVRLRYPEASDRDVAQEVMARMAETDPGSNKLNFIRAVVRQWLRDMARAVGISLKVTNEELNDLIAKASAYMREGKNLDVRAEPTGLVAASNKGQQSIEVDMQRTFEKRILDYFKSDQPQAVKMSDNTPASLQLFGWNDLPVVVDPNVIDKMHFNHGMTVPQISKLPSLLKRPLMIFGDTKNNSLVFVGEHLKDGKIVLVAMKPVKGNSSTNGLDVSMVVTGYDPSNGWSEVTKRLMRGELVYRDTTQDLPVLVRSIISSAQKKYAQVGRELPRELLQGREPGTYDDSSEKTQSGTRGPTVRSTRSVLERNYTVLGQSDLVKIENEIWPDGAKFSLSAQSSKPADQSRRSME